MKYKYGEFTNFQIDKTKAMLRKQIFFLLLCVDPKTKQDYANIDVVVAFQNLLSKIGGLNELLLCPPELVTVSGLLQSALLEYQKKDFSFSMYRKLLLDAGAEVLKIQEGD